MQKFSTLLTGRNLSRFLLFSFFTMLYALPAFSQSDPDMPDFARYKLNKEEFMKRRAEAIGKMRGIADSNTVIDPQLRLNAIRQMEAQEQDLRSTGRLIGDPWVPIGPAPIPNGQVAIAPSTAVSGRVTAIAVHPTNPNIVYAGTAQGGVYRTTNGGTTWTPIMDAAQSLAVGAIAIAPSSPETVYVGTGEPNFSADSYFGVGVYRIDNASTAATLSGPFNLNASAADIFTGRSIGEIIVHPTNPAVIFVASTSGIGGIVATGSPSQPSRGIYRCDNATSASPIFNKLTGLLSNINASVRDIAIDPNNPDILLAVVIASGGSGGIHRSTNAMDPTPANVTFTQTFVVNSTSTSTLNGELAGIHPAGDLNATFYAALGFNGGSVHRSTDGGVTWTQQIDNNFCGGQCFYDIAIAIDPTNANTVYLGGDPTIVAAKSTNGGTSFTDSKVGVHVDTHVLTVSSSDPTQVWLGTDGGVYKSTNSGGTWVNQNTGQFSATQFMSIDVHPTDANFTIGGTQDNGTNWYQPAGTWLRIDGGDGGYAVIDQNATDNTNVRQYHTYFNATNLQGYGTTATAGGAFSFRGCQVTGATVNGITCNGTINFYAPLERGPGNPNTIYYGSDRLYRSADNGTTHTVVSQNPIASGVPISAIGISPQNDNVRIVGLNNGGLFGTSTGATTLVDLDPTNTVPNAGIARTIVDPNSATTAYVTLSAFGVTNVWKTTNLGDAGTTWTSAASGLPQIPVNAFIVDPANSNNLFAGTDIGVYGSTDGGATWLPYGTGLPRVAVFDMAITGLPTKVLRIATHGRGMWQNSLALVPPTVTIDQAVGQADPTATSPINFTVVFSEAVTGFATGDVTLSGTAGATTATVTGGPTTYNVAVSGMTGNGTVIANIGAGVATGTVNAVGNAASTSTDNQVTFSTCVTNPVVTNNNDAGAGSLRQAVIDACPGSTITFNMASVVSPITLTSGEISINKNLTIQGPGAAVLTISGNNNGRIFYVNGAGVVGNINMLTLTNGNGAGVTNTGRGGALYNNGATMNMQGLVITANTAANGGGFNTAGNGTTTLTNSTVSNNTTTSSGGSFQNFSGSTTHVLGSTISGNTSNSTTGGGAMQANGTVTITNSTISGNTAGSGGDGGGIMFNGASLSIVNSTITNNTANDNGGGIFRSGVNPLTVINTIIAGNNATTGGPDAFGDYTSQGFNLIGKTDGSTGFTQPTDLTGTVASPLNPQLGPLANNGGTTFTHLLLNNSPAIDKGAAANNPVSGNPIITDQRNATRPVDNAGISNAPGGNASDIGAVELASVVFVAPTVTINQAVGQADPTGTSPINFTVVFSEAVTGFATGDVTLSGTAGATTGTVTGGPSTYNVAVSGMTGSGTVLASINAGVATGTVNLVGNAASTSTDNQVTFNAPCDISNVTVNNASACNNNGTPSDPSDDYFTADVVVTFANPPATGSLDIEPGGDALPGGGALSVPVSGLSSPHTFTGIRFKADGTPTVVEVEFSAQASTCVRTATGPTVNSCSAAVCTISNVTVTNASGCNDNGTPSNPADDYFTADVVVTFANPPTTGSLDIEPGGDALPGGGALTVPVSGLSSPYTFTGIRFRADGTPTVVEVEFSAQAATCVRTAVGPTVSSCSVSCSITVPGTLTTADPTFNRPVTLTALSGVGTAVHHDAIPFTITNAGNVTISCEVADGGSISPNGTDGNGPDTYLCLYGPGGFNAASPLTNLIAINDDISGATNRRSRIISNLAVGSYTAVLTSFGNTPTNTSGDDVLPWTYTLAINPTCAPCVLTCPVNVTTGSDAGQCGAIVNYPAPTLSGNCGTVTATPASGSFFPVGTTTVNVTSTAGPSCSFTVTVTDNQPPTITCPANITVSNDAGLCSALVNYTLPTAIDNCPGTTVASSHPSGSAFSVGTTTVTLTATDAAGNTASCQFTVTVNDTQAPTITCPAAVTVSCAANIPAVNIGAVTATDNCPGVAVTHVSDVISAQTCANRFTVTRTYLATDAAGNTAACTQIITVNDVTPPTITCPSAVTVSCATNVPAVNTSAVTATDNCTGAVAITHMGDVISNQTCANRFTITRTYRATDVCGNFSECTQIITVNDVTPPTITCPAAVTVSCASAVPAANTALVTATDNCAGAVTITHVGDVISNQTCANRFTITRTYNATDVCGNSSTCTQIITVNDITAPVLTCPANISVNTPLGSCTAVVNFTPTATDNCGGAVTIASVPASGTAFAIGTTTVNVTATDACGNSTTCSFTVTVADGQLPVITTQPSNRAVCVGANATFSVAAVTAPNAGGSLAYQWQQWNGTAWVNIAGATASSYTVSNVTQAMNTNTFRAVITGLCTVVNSSAATLTVNPLPSITLNASPTASLLPNLNTTITATVNPSGGSFVWSLNGATINGVTGNVLGPIGINGIGAYQAVYTDGNGCVSTSAVLNITAMPSTGLWVYPVPNTGVFNVRFFNQTGEQATLQVFNALGQQVYSQKLTLGVAYSNIVVALDNVPAGTYIVKVVNSSNLELGAKRVIIYHP